MPEQEITIAEVQSIATLQREECGVAWYTSNEYGNLHYLVHEGKVHVRYGFWARTMFMSWPMVVQSTICRKRANKMEEFTTFEQAYECYYPAIYHFFFKYYHNRQMTEDLTKETFLRAWRSWHTIEKINVKWFYRIAHRLLTDQWRRTQLIEWCELSDELTAILEDGGEDHAEAELELRLAASMCGLTPECRLVLRMDIAGYSLDEIMSALHKSKSAVLMMIYRAKKHAGKQWIAQELEVA